MRIYGTLYKITCLVNKMVYIGQTLQNVETRWKDHIRGNGSKPLYGDIQRYGVENFKFEVLLAGIDCRDRLNQLEIDLITLNDSHKKGYNKHRGGQDRYRESEAWRHAEEICRLRTTEHKTLRELGKRFNTSSVTIKRVLNACSVDTQRISYAWKHQNEICSLFEEFGLTQKELAERYFVSKSTITNILRENNIELKGRGRVQRRLYKYTEEILRLYTKEFLSYEKIAKRFGTNSVSVRRFIKGHNIDTRKYSPRTQFNED